MSAKAAAYQHSATDDASVTAGAFARSFIVQLALITTLLLGCLLVLTPRARADTASDGFSVSPLKFEVEQSPGNTSSHVISITNTTEHNLTFAVTTEDIAGSKDDPNATPVLLGGTVTSPISGTSWLSPNVDSFKLAAGATHNLTVRITVPSGATGGHYAAVMISSTPVTSSGGGAVATSRAAVVMMMNAGGVAPPELVFQNITTTKDGGTVIDYINKGHKAVKPEAIVEYYDVMTGTKVATRKASDCGTALPGGSARCTVDPRPGSGTTASGSSDDALLVARPVVELRSDGRRARAKEPLEWSGSWSSVLLPLTGLL
ncbi:MAG: hypothetical protein H7123_06595, partial [Thermoleophilia bacterium]|nr:hypothetical protein [Thermoleophilia bacterium]